MRQIIAQIVQPVISQAAQEASERFIRSLPFSQFERTEYNVRWDSEE